MIDEIVDHAEYGSSIERAALVVSRARARGWTPGDDVELDEMVLTYDVLDETDRGYLLGAEARALDYLRRAAADGTEVRWMDGDLLVLPSCTCRCHEASPTPDCGTVCVCGARA